MKKNDFFLCLSQKEGKEAAKEISLKIKSTFSQTANFLFLLFTPGYHPPDLLKTFNLVLKSPSLFGIKAPFLIYKDRVIKKGVVSYCINKKGSKFDVFFIGPKNPERIEYNLRSGFKKNKAQEMNFISFLSPQISPLFFLESLRFALGKLNNFSGLGYEDKNPSTGCFMFNTGIGDGLVNLNMKGINTKSIPLHNFIPLGKPFDITKLNFKQQIIHEINNRPAAEIYKEYLEEKFNTFIKNRLFRYYPLGIPSGNSFRILEVTNILEDGSFLYRGNLRYNAIANIMILKKKYSKESLSRQLEQSFSEEEGVVFIVNSLSRKKNLGKESEKEIKNIHSVYSPKKETFGLFSNYCFFSDHKTQDTNIESGGLLINVWE